SLHDATGEPEALERLFAGLGGVDPADVTTLLRSVLQSVPFFVEVT
ncbi:MAG: hypothetical protein GWM90_08170, partial [Gemmatimonadetes bacterium]|nr:hypothetical protein [Gemmatimonadota bacterium]NIQ53851.1 hypothetical protein [Gemmatimonadota bacterium]NIU74018.1 hypothetical protein [Gammaproteobacteria bacterium]NIX44087.1 hypothetical protein [Gemmatimonadota bacterium]